MMSDRRGFEIEYHRLGFGQIERVPFLTDSFGWKRYINY